MSIYLLIYTERGNEMVGVDEFRNQDQARKCCETAQKNLERINKFFIPTIILSVISPIVIQAAWTCSMRG